MSINKLFDISRTSLFAYQQALSITSGNISNASNPNYTRQRVIMGTMRPDHRANFTFGSGVTIDDVVRVKSQITEKQIRSNSTIFSNHRKDSEILGQIETLFSEPTELGLSNLINEFFNSWDELSVNPTSMPLRSNVLQSTQKLTGKLQNVYEGLDEVRLGVKDETKAVVTEINQITAEIQVLNKQIYEANVAGRQPNDLLDKRDVLINQLSNYANLQVSFDEQNVANISIGGVFVADRLHHVDLKIVEENGNMLIKTEDDAAKLTLNGGELNSLVKNYARSIPEYKSKLDQIGQALFDKINEIHSGGFSIETPPGTGYDFFESYADGVLKINSDIIENPTLISISQDGSNGNNVLALQISDLKNSSLIDGLTIGDSYSGLVSDVANSKQLNEQTSGSYKLVLDQLQQQKLETSGVSIDEEMVNVLKYQRSYDAAAKLIGIADELLGTLINMV